MTNELKILEELAIEESLKDPHLSYVIGTMQERKRVAHLVLSKNEDEILLINHSGFLIDSVFAGLTEKNIEYISKNGPAEYKKSLWNMLQDSRMVRDAFEISKSMDEDSKGNNNEVRLKNVTQYIKDNWIAFKF